MILIELTSIDKYRNKKTYKYNDQSSSSQGEHVEKLIIITGKCRIDIVHTEYIEKYLDHRYDVEYTPLYTIEDDEKCDIEKWKEKHIYRV
jgi:hypothetical protein